MNYCDHCASSFHVNETPNKKHLCAVCSHNIPRCAASRRYDRRYYQSLCRKYGLKWKAVQPCN